MAATNVLQEVDPKQQWLADRKHFIGGSEIYQLLNEPQYGQGCVRALAYDKLDVPPDYPDQIDNPLRSRLFKRGHIMEPVAAALYAEETGRKLRNAPMDANGLPKAKIHPEFPWAGVHYDRLVLAGSGGVTETGTAEIKSRGKGPYLQMLKSGCFPGDVLQTQHGMFVNRHNWGTFIAIGLFDSRGDEDGMGALPLKHFDMKRDELIIDVIKHAGERFAETVFVKRELPDRPFAGDDARCKVCAWRMECRGEELDAAEAARLKAIKKGDRALVQIENAELAQRLASRDLTKAQLRTITNPDPSKNFPDPGDLDREESRIKELLGENVAVNVEGYGKVYYDWRAGRTTMEIGKAMEYLKDIAKQASGLAVAAEVLSNKPGWNEVEFAEMVGTLAQAVTVLKNVEAMPEVVSSKFCKVGEPYRMLQTFPNKVSS
jgi:hypothetical protein